VPCRVQGIFLGAASARVGDSEDGLLDDSRCRSRTERNPEGPSDERSTQPDWNAGALVDGRTLGHDKLFVDLRFTASLPQFP